MQIIDFILIFLIAAVLIGAVIRCVHRKKKGGCCCGDCSSCSGCGHKS